ncbi:hypothetical protein ACF081_33890 [Streptomyces longwoodensis]|uniref:hypothetical protein n=1 Tax=Streptomyces longwoodensis TaxID=68231 RepID=UPI0036FD964A
MRVVLGSAAEVCRRRRAYRLLWPVWAVPAAVGGWGLVQVVRIGDGRGYDGLFGLLVTAAGTVLLGSSSLRSLVLTRGFGTPGVSSRRDDREPCGVRHGWAAPRPVDGHGRRS